MLLDKCTDLFATFVDKNGRVNYNLLRRKRAKLFAIARDFENIHPAEPLSWSQNEKVAFWLNAYNIFTLKLVIDNYPIEPSPYLSLIYPENSIMQIPGAWTKKYFKVQGLEYTLREIEREILLQRFGDLRVCFALSYANLSSAFLRNEPYYPDKLDKQLDEHVKKYLSSPRGLRIDNEKKTVYLSSIFNRYKEFFVNSKYAKIKKFRDQPTHIRAYLNFVINYIPPEKAKSLESKGYAVDFLRYDWQLNEQQIR